MQGASKHPRSELSSSSAESEGPSPKFPRLADDEEMDKQVMALAGFQSPVPDSSVPTLLIVIVLCSRGRLNPAYAVVDNAIGLLEEHPDIVRKLREAFSKGRFGSIRSLSILQKPLLVESYVEGADEQLPKMHSTTATEVAWKSPYVGNSHETLWDQIRAAYTISLTKSYAHILPITQSSGTGKSRLVDEVSKEHFVIPINLRDQDGYPPPDNADMRHWLIEPTNPLDSTHRLAAFLMALFIHVAETIMNIDSLIADALTSLPTEDWPTTISAKFRVFMTHGQTYGKPGKLRQEFYKNVLEIGKTMEIKIRIDKTTMQDSDSWRHYFFEGVDLAEKAKNVIDIICQASGNNDDLNPFVLLAFDEAHTLLHPPHEALQDQVPWNHFSELGRVLRSLSRIGLFTLFLSTSRKIREFSPQPADAPSSRIQRAVLKQHSPFTAVGFDHLALRITTGEVTLEEASETRRIVQLGRPLFGSRYEAGSDSTRKTIVDFAGEKLLGRTNDPLSATQKLACLAMRMPVEFNSTSIGLERADTLVAKHMRLCLDASPSSPLLVTITPSEPILAEAAKLHMCTPDFRPAEALHLHLTDSGLDKSNRGELIAMLLLILAYNSLGPLRRVVTVIEFLQALVPVAVRDSVLQSHPYQWRTEDDGKKQLKVALSKASIWFNHFVKVQEYGVLNRSYLCALMIRGAAILCADGQAGVDLIIPFVAGDHIIREDNIGVIMIQVKNDKSYRATPRGGLYGAMDPTVLCGFPETHSIPCIRIVFALASDEDAVVAQQREGQPMRISNKKFHAFTSYDLWFAKASSKTFRPIHVSDEGSYESMLQLIRSFPRTYDNQEYVDSVRTALRTMNPGTALNEAHWRFFKFSDSSTAKTVTSKKSRAMKIKDSVGGSLRELFSG